MPTTIPAWAIELMRRAVHRFVVKVAGVGAFTWLYFIAYLHLLRHPAFPVTVMPLTPLDHAIAFQPAALYAYVSLWLYVGVAPGLQRSGRELLVYAAWMAAMCGVSVALFYRWPTAVPALWGAEGVGLPGFSTLHAVDAAGNACPSMHVAAATFAAIRIGHLLARAGTPGWLRAANAVWFIAIVWSTLATKQHVALDALAGALLGVAFALPSLRWRPRDIRTSAAPGSLDIIGGSRRTSRQKARNA